MINSYLEGKITLAQVRKQSKFDSFGWGWKWESISRVLVIGKELRLRVISAEKGEGDMSDIEDRNKFTSEIIRKDALKNPGKYVILYGAGHNLGNLSTPIMMAKLGLHPQVVHTPYLGRLAEDVIKAAGSEDAKCLSFDRDIYYYSPLSPLEGLRSYYQELLTMDQQETKAR